MPKKSNKTSGPHRGGRSLGPLRTSENMNKEIIRVRELSDREIEKLDKRKGFRDFRPVECADCGFKGTFPRRLFLVEGVKDESDRGILRLNKQHKVIV